MFVKISQKIAENLKHSSIIDSEEQELYAYGFKQGFIIVLNLVTTLAIGLLLGKVLEISLFMTAYIPVRTYAGGYHAKTTFRCYLLSVMMLTAVTLCIKYLWLPNIVYDFVMIASIVVVLLFSPVEDSNKPLDAEEVQVYRKRTLYLLLTETIVFSIMRFLKFQVFAIAICYAMIVLGVMLILGVVKNKSYF